MSAGSRTGHRTARRRDDDERQHLEPVPHIVVAGRTACRGPSHHTHHRRTGFQAVHRHHAGHHESFRHRRDEPRLSALRGTGRGLPVPRALHGGRGCVLGDLFSGGWRDSRGRGTRARYRRRQRSRRPRLCRRAADDGCERAKTFLAHRCHAGHVAGHRCGSQPHSGRSDDRRGTGAVCRGHHADHQYLQLAGQRNRSSACRVD